MTNILTSVSRVSVVNEFESKYGFQPRSYLIFIGRLVEGKNIITAGDWAAIAKKAGLDVNLLICGSGPMHYDLVDRYRDHKNIRVVGRVSEEEKIELITNALALVNLSDLESFSLTVMEAWKLGVPVLVSKNCWVTRYHSDQSGGGISVGNEMEFALACSRLMYSEHDRSSMGSLGKEYVLKNFSRDVVVSKLKKAFLGLDQDKIN